HARPAGRLWRAGSPPVRYPQGMATLEPQTHQAVPAQMPTCVQPGGGFCCRLELWWGKVRRTLLRWFCPGYVRRMAEKRQGTCSECTHDIIDWRDLKYWRNACGYWFLPPDAVLPGKPCCGLARYGLM